MKSPYHIWLRRLSKLTVFSTLFLIFAGALVKSHEVGLSVPDWPTTYGKQMFAYPISEMVGGIFYEHGHRMVATIVGFFTMVQAIWLGFSQEPQWLKKLGFFALGMVILQGLFGGIIFSAATCFNHSWYFGTNFFYDHDCFGLWVIN
jgi:cytochrome c oxidase assembly protein subunit 15